MIAGRVAAGAVLANSSSKTSSGGISPAVVSIYMAYHVDRQITTTLLPDIGSFEHWRLPQRLMSCGFFGMLVAGFSALPTLSISVSRSPWPVGKLQIVIIGTTFTIGLIMALVGEFVLIAPTLGIRTG